MDSGLKGSEQKQSLMNSGREDSAALWMVLVIGQAEFEVVDLLTEDYSITGHPAYRSAIFSIVGLHKDMSITEPTAPPGVGFRRNAMKG